MHDEELTPAERDAFASLPRTSQPGDLLEERTVRALAARGLLHRTVRASRNWVWMTAAAAACAIFFVAGFTIGHLRGARDEATLAAIRDDAMRTNRGPNGQDVPPWQPVNADSSQAGTRYVVWF